MLNKKNKTVNGLVFAVIAVLVLTGLASEAQANLVDSNSIIKDDIEYYFQTDKSVYNLGETVDMLYRVTNLRDESITFQVGVQECYFQVANDDGIVWWWPKLINPGFTTFTLMPGEFKQYPKDWDMINDNGTINPDDNFLVNPGIYDVSSVLRGGGTDGTIPESVSVSIQIIPEPSTITLLGAGLLGILSYRKRKK